MDFESKDPHSGWILYWGGGGGGEYFLEISNMPSFKIPLPGFQSMQEKPL